MTCAEVPGKAELVPGAVVAFEVVSPGSQQAGRFVKVREYHAVPSIQRYIIVEQDMAGLLVLRRASGEGDWTATTLTAGGVLAIPEIGAQIPVDEFYEGVRLAPGTGGVDPQPAA